MFTCYVLYHEANAAKALDLLVLWQPGQTMTHHHCQTMTHHHFQKMTHHQCQTMTQHGLVRKTCHHYLSRVLEQDSLKSVPAQHLACHKVCEHHGKCHT